MPLRRRGGLARRYPNRRAPADAGSADFEELVGSALNGLPRPSRTLLGNAAMVIEDKPTEEESMVSTGPHGPYGLYEGTPLIAYAADQVAFPTKITLSGSRSRRISPSRTSS